MLKIQFDGVVYEEKYPLRVTDFLTRLAVPFPLLCNLNGVLRDLRTIINTDSVLTLVNFDDEGGKKVFWHSSAHILGYALTECYPGCSLAAGPATDNGFYYDVKLPRPFSQVDYEVVEKKARDIIKKGYLFLKQKIMYRDMKSFYAKNPYKLHFLEKHYESKQKKLAGIEISDDKCSDIRPGNESLNDAVGPECDKTDKTMVSNNLVDKLDRKSQDLKVPKSEKEGRKGTWNYIIKPPGSVPKTNSQKADKSHMSIKDKKSPRKEKYILEHTDVDNFSSLKLTSDQKKQLLLSYSDGNTPATEIPVTNDGPNFMETVSNQFPMSHDNKPSNDPNYVLAYKLGDFLDLCTGPHIYSTKHVRAFKILNHSSSYFLGDSKNDSLQRIYGISFPSNEQLKNYIKQREEAKLRDHRRVGAEHGLFHFNELSPGSCFFTSKGAFIYNKLIEFLRLKYRNYGYKEVITPNIYAKELWETSGHYQNYKENMFHTNVENHEFSLKPMNCPAHCILFKSTHTSYKALPLKMADFGILHRNEASGALTGLTRVRRFQQDDAHIFCSMDDVQNMISECLKFMDSVYTTFGFHYDLRLSTRPEKFIGQISTWDAAEQKLKNALDDFCRAGDPDDSTAASDIINLKDNSAESMESSNTSLFAEMKSSAVSTDSDVIKDPKGDDLSLQREEMKLCVLKKNIKRFYSIGDKDGAFYGPKIDITIKDACGRSIQCGTIQLDFQLPQRFDLKYLDRDGVLKQPVIIHRAILGSIERFIGILLETFGMKLPFWLTPHQIMLVTVNERNLSFAEKVKQSLLMFEVNICSDQSMTLAKKIKMAQQGFYKLICVIGDQEEQTNTVNIRNIGVFSLSKLKNVAEKMCSEYKEIEEILLDEQQA